MRGLSLDTLLPSVTLLSISLACVAAAGDERLVRNRSRSSLMFAGRLVTVLVRWTILRSRDRKRICSSVFSSGIDGAGI